MENVMTKSPEKSRRKFLVFGLVAVICMLSFLLYKQHILKKDLVRRKMFLIGKLRESKVAERESAHKLEQKAREVVEQKKEIDSKKQEVEKINQQLTSLTNDYNKKVHEFQELKASASESKERMDALDKHYRNASSVIAVMSDKLSRIINSYQEMKEQKDALNKAMKEKEEYLEKCLKEKAKQGLQKAKQGLQKAKQDLQERASSLVPGPQTMEPERLSSTIQTQPLSQPVELKRKTATAELTGQPRSTSIGHTSRFYSQTLSVKPLSSRSIVYNNGAGESQSASITSQPSSNTDSQLPENVSSNVPREEVVQ